MFATLERSPEMIQTATGAGGPRALEVGATSAARRPSGAACRWPIQAEGSLPVESPPSLHGVEEVHEAVVGPGEASTALLLVTGKGGQAKEPAVVMIVDPVAACAPAGGGLVSGTRAHPQLLHVPLAQVAPGPRSTLHTRPS